MKKKKFEEGMLRLSCCESITGHEAVFVCICKLSGNVVETHFTHCSLLLAGVFFFQAEDGIRDKLVTGVQTCALPIWHRHARAAGRGGHRRAAQRAGRGARSEERRVGKECRSRWWPYHEKKKVRGGHVAPELLRVDNRARSCLCLHLQVEWQCRRDPLHALFPAARRRFFFSSRRRHTR